MTIEVTNVTTLARVCAELVKQGLTFDARIDTSGHSAADVWVITLTGGY